MWRHVKLSELLHLMKIVVRQCLCEYKHLPKTLAKQLQTTAKTNKYRSNVSQRRRCLSVAIVGVLALSKFKYDFVATIYSKKYSKFTTTARGHWYFRRFFA